MSLASINFLQDRARMFARARNFFSLRNVLEVDPPALLDYPPNDAHIDLIETTDGAFLHSSPEYAMKRLLAAGLGDCYFLAHVYRRNEHGPLHRPEFTMAEWYRTGFSLPQMIEETAEFLFLFFEKVPIRHLSYRSAFEQYAGIDYTAISLPELHELTQSQWDRSTCIHYLLTHKVEPHLGQNELTALVDFPPHEAALACTTFKNGEEVAERFEIYHKGIELANGYHELSDATELRRRFERLNKERTTPYAIDEAFLAALNNLPPCCGVALGFDRALMLRHNLTSIAPVLPL